MVLVDVFITTMSYGFEISWSLVKTDADGNKIVACSGGHYPSNQKQIKKECELEKMVDYELICEDEWGDGWNGGFIEIAGLKYCSNFNNISPNRCANTFTYGCNTKVTIKYIKLTGTTCSHFKSNVDICDVYSCHSNFCKNTIYGY